MRVGMRTAAEVEKAYLAGLVDGERSFCISEHQSSRKGRWLQPCFDICNNDEECLEYVREMYGGTINTVKDRAHHLRFTHPKIIKSILEDLLPYLIVKKEEAKVMLNFCESRLRRRGTPYTRNELAWCEALRILNRE
jgi:hypothetical protein